MEERSVGSTRHNMASTGSVLAMAEEGEISVQSSTYDIQPPPPRDSQLLIRSHAGRLVVVRSACR